MDIIKNLLKIKSIVTIVVIAIFAYCAITGKLTTENIMVIVTMIVTFYFTRNNSGGGENVG